MTMPWPHVVGGGVADPGGGERLLERDARVDLVADGDVGEGVEVGQSGVVGVDEQGVRDGHGPDAVEVHDLHDRCGHRRGGPDRREAGGERYGGGRPREADGGPVAHLGGGARPCRVVDEIERPYLVGVAPAPPVEGRIVLAHARLLPRLVHARAGPAV